MSNNPVKATIEALYKPIEGIVKTLAGPAAEEIGLSFRDSVQAWRLKRQIRLFEKVKQICNGAGIKPQAVKLSLLFDIVENASLEEDDELQDMWAALLANAADPKRESLASSAFPEILKQLSKSEAVFLNYLIVNQDEEIDQKLGTWRGQKFLMSKRRAAIVIKLPSMLEANLSRLGLIEKDGKMELTPFGEAFIRACMPPNSQNTTARS